jgi:hypothetical protein
MEVHPEEPTHTISRRSKRFQTLDVGTYHYGSHTCHLRRFYLVLAHVFIIFDGELELVDMINHFGGDTWHNH